MSNRIPGTIVGALLVGLFAIPCVLLFSRERSPGAREGVSADLPVLSALEQTPQRVQSDESGRRMEMASGVNEVPGDVRALAQPGRIVVDVRDLRGAPVKEGTLELAIFGEGGARESRSFSLGDGGTCLASSWPALSEVVRRGGQESVRFHFTSESYQPATGWLSEIGIEPDHYLLVVERVYVFNFVVGIEDQSSILPGQLSLRRIPEISGEWGQATVVTGGPEFLCSVNSKRSGLPMWVTATSTGFYPVTVYLDVPPGGTDSAVDMGRYGMTSMGESIGGSVWLGGEVPVSDTHFQVRDRDGEVVYSGVTGGSGEFLISGVDETEYWFDLVVPIIGESEIGLPARIAVGVNNQIVLPAQMYVFTIDWESAVPPSSTSDAAVRVHLSVLPYGESTGGVSYMTRSERDADGIRLIVPEDSVQELEAMSGGRSKGWFGAKMLLDGTGKQRLIEENLSLSLLDHGEYLLVSSSPGGLGVRFSLRQAGTGFSAGGAGLDSYSVGQVYPLFPGTWKAHFNPVAGRGELVVATEDVVVFDVRAGERSEVLIETVLGGTIDLLFVPFVGSTGPSSTGVEGVVSGESVTVDLTVKGSNIPLWLRFSENRNGTPKMVNGRFVAMARRLTSSGLRPGEYSLQIVSRGDVKFTTEFSIVSGASVTIEVPLFSKP